MRGGFSGGLIDRMVKFNVDPDRLAILTREGADYEQLGFPTQGMAKKLSEYGILKSVGRRHKRVLIEDRKETRFRTIWVPGCHFDRWLADYILNRTRYRIQSGLSLEISPELQARFEAFQKNRKKSGYRGFSLKEASADLMEEIQALL
jgi:hypothetical protein